MFITILGVTKKENEEVYNKILEACKWMVDNDKSKDFTFREVPGGGIIINNPQGKNQAYKRGAYFRKKHGVYYEVRWEG
jgi:hypothetical protein